MKNNVDEIINNFFMPHTVKKSADQLTINELLSLVKQVESALPLLEQKEKAVETKEVVVAFPQIKINENWGKPSSKDRQIIENFTRKIAGNTIKEKLERINSILEEQIDNPETTVPQILSSFVILSAFKSLKTEFSASSAGLLFESLIAALFGTTAQQLNRALFEKDRIEDVEFNGQFYSLKFLNSTTKIRGSFNKLFQFFEDQRIKKITYLVARSDNYGNIEFYEKVLSNEKEDDDYKYSLEFYIKNKTINLYNKSHEEIAELLNNNKVQFAIRRVDESIGTLNCSEKYINSKASNCAKLLQAQLFPIYEALGSLSNNVNAYFLSEDGNEAVVAANKAIKDTETLKANFNSVLSDPANVKK